MTEREYSWKNDQLDYRKADRIVAGVDVGTTNSRAVILLDGQLYALSQVRTLMPADSAQKAMNLALVATGLQMKEIRRVVATGQGRMRVPFASNTVTEILCAAAGSIRIWGHSVRTVLDAGGQSCRVIHCTEKGRVTSFLWNDKCAAGIGSSIETFAGLLNMDISEMGKLSIRSDSIPRISDFCSVYARSEALDLVRSKVQTEQVIAAYLDAMARRIGTLVARAGMMNDFVIAGGISKIRRIVESLESILRAKPLPPPTGWDPAFTTGLGAALLADSFFVNQF